MDNMRYCKAAQSTCAGPMRYMYCPGLSALRHIEHHWKWGQLVVDVTTPSWATSLPRSAMMCLLARCDCGDQIIFLAYVEHCAPVGIKKIWLLSFTKRRAAMLQLLRYGMHVSRFVAKCFASLETTSSDDVAWTVETNWPFEQIYQCRLPENALEDIKSSNKYVCTCTCLHYLVLKGLGSILDLCPSTLNLNIECMHMHSISQACTVCHLIE